MLVTELLKQNAARYPGQEALAAVCSKDIVPLGEASYTACRRAYTWAEFDQTANRAANYYRSIGIGPGNKVAIMMMNCIEWLPVYFGVLRSGAAAVPLNFRYHAEDIIRSVRFAEIDAMVLDGHCRDEVEKCLPEIPEVRSFVYVGADGDCPSFAKPWKDSFALADPGDPGVKLAGEDMAAIYFSSGTTGTPKAVVYTHETLERACELEHGNHKQVHEDNFILIPPLYHVGGKLHWMGNLLVGARCVLLLGFQVDAFFEVMRRERVTISFLLLPWVQDILFQLDSGRLKLTPEDVPSWRMLHMGAQPIPPSVVRQMQRYFPELAYEVSYGLTESGGPGCLNLPADRLDKLGSVGVPAKGWQARIVDGHDAPVEAEQTGELLLRGPGVMRGYYKAPEQTAAALRGGWLHTGDLAKRDRDGFYYIVGRLKDVIISGGENVYPVQVEEFLRTHPAVQDAAVFGICDCRLGEAVVAQIELKDGQTCTEGELMDFCQELPRFQRPRKLFFGKVPRNPTGKIDKKALRSQYSVKHPFTSHAHL